MPIPFEQQKSIAVVLPAHNEADHIEGVLDSVPHWVDRIYVVDDASTDATAETVERRSESRVTLIRHDRNRGVGGAMRTGYEAALEAGFDLIAKMDADGQMNGAELGRLVEPFALGMAEYTKGNRFYFRGATARMPQHRQFGNTALSFLTKLATGYWHVFDSQCGFTVVSAAYLRLLDLEDLPDDYFFENAMLIRLNALSARVVDVPITTIYGHEVSGVSIRRVLLSFPPRLVGWGLSRFWRKHLVTDFDPIGGLSALGLTLTAVGLTFGGYHWIISVLTGVPATTGTVMIAVLPVVVGMELFVQAFVLGVLSSPGSSETAAYVRYLISEGRL